jgi:hypothetical protein
MRKLFLTVSLCLCLVSTAAVAAPYGTAGCGLGSMIWHDDKGAIQILAATFNGSFGSQTFGISTGTSNCAETTNGGKAAQIFIEANREALAKDMSRGSGETIANLSSIAGCPNPAAVGATLQRNFKAIFPDEKVPNEIVVNSVLSTLKSEKALACSHLG